MIFWGKCWEDDLGCLEFSGKSRFLLLKKKKIEGVLVKVCVFVFLAIL